MAGRGAARADWLAVPALGRLGPSASLVPPWRDRRVCSRRYTSAPAPAKHLKIPHPTQCTTPSPTFRPTAPRRHQQTPTRRVHLRSVCVGQVQRRRAVIPAGCRRGSRRWDSSGGGGSSGGDGRGPGRLRCAAQTAASGILVHFLPCICPAVQARDTCQRPASLGGINAHLLLHQLQRFRADGIERAEGVGRGVRALAPPQRNVGQHLRTGQGPRKFHQKKGESAVGHGRRSLQTAASEAQPQPRMVPWPCVARRTPSHRHRSLVP